MGKVKLMKWEFVVKIKNFHFMGFWGHKGYIFCITNPFNTEKELISNEIKIIKWIHP